MIRRFQIKTDSNLPLDLSDSKIDLAVEQTTLNSGGLPFVQDF